MQPEIRNVVISNEVPATPRMIFSSTIHQPMPSPASTPVIPNIVQGRVISGAPVVTRGPTYTVYLTAPEAPRHFPVVLSSMSINPTHLPMTMLPSSSPILSRALPIFSPSLGFQVGFALPHFGSTMPTMLTYQSAKTGLLQASPFTPRVVHQEKAPFSSDLPQMASMPSMADAEVAIMSETVLGDEVSIQVSKSEAAIPLCHAIATPAPEPVDEPCEPREAGVGLLFVVAEAPNKGWAVKTIMKQSPAHLSGEIQEGHILSSVDGESVANVASLGQLSKLLMGMEGTSVQLEFTFGSGKKGKKYKVSLIRSNAYLGEDGSKKQRKWKATRTDWIDPTQAVDV